jgi:tetratricopeptide (TPR) repeat protein
MNENYEKAVEIYTQMQELPDKTINVYIKTMIAECYAQLEDFEKAFQALQSIIDNNTNDSHTYMNYVRCSMETDRRQEASRILRRTANLLPDELRPLTDIAINLLEIGNTNQALSITDKIIKYIDEEDSKDYYIDENTDLLAKHPKTCKYFFFQTPLPVNKLVYAYLNDNGCRN